MLMGCCGGYATDAASKPTQPSVVVPVEVWIGGDDALTLRLADAIRNEFRHSSLFTLAPAFTSHSLRVTIPTNVGWEKMSGRTRVKYKVQFYREGHEVVASGGVCWEDDLAPCARDIRERAVRAVSE
jgi:hypothetical protein